MDDVRFIAIYVTFPDQSTAESMTHLLLEKRLVACANIFPAGRSFYRWKGVLHSESEVYAVFKTEIEFFETVRAEVVATHPYEVPCVVAFPVISGHTPYLAWLSEEVSRVS